MIRSTTITQAGRSIRSRLVYTAVAALLLIAASVVFGAIDRSTAVDGPAGSSYVTTSTGAAALFDLLDRFDRRPVRSLGPVTASTLTDASSFVVLDPGFVDFTELELSSIRAFVERGGTLVIGGTPPTDLAGEFLPDDLEWSPAVHGSSYVVVPLSTAPLTLEARRFGSFPTIGGALPLAIDSDGAALAVAAGAGRGLVVAVADIDVVSNAGLPRAHNLDFVLEILGEGPVVFDEYRLGYSEGTAGGLVAAAPGNWDHAVWLLGAAIIIALVVYGRRLGPPEPSDRDLAPDRSLFLESVARTLRRSGDPVAATEPVRIEIRRLLADRRGVSALAESELRREAAAHGLTSEEIAAVFGPTTDSVVVADRAFKKLNRRQGEHP